MKRSVKILICAVAVLCAVAAVSYLLYEIIILKMVLRDHIFNAFFVVSSMIVVIYRISTGTVRNRKKKRYSPQFFRDHYGDYIGKAFVEPSKTGEKFFRALHFYQYDEPAQLVKALESIESSCRTNDERFAVVFFKALGYQEMQVYEKAAETYERALMFREVSTAASNMGSCYDHMGNYERAIDAYRYAIKIEPNNAFPYNNLAHLFIKRDEFELAIEYADEALARKENMHQAYSAKALAYAMLGYEEDFEDALRHAVLCGGDREQICKAARAMGAEIFMQYVSI